ncbi:MAG: Smr/MutS family protein [Gammaproteobacteria bacterium]|nr:Smr/MutS family protein [Gammaproteobacteria bacterium]
MSSQEDDKQNPDNGDDLSLFREAMRDVRPLDIDERIQPGKKRPSPRPRFSQADERAVLGESLQLTPEELDIETGEELLYCRAGVPRNAFRDLRRGRFRPAAELDLHGMTAEAAGTAIRRFLEESLDYGMRCVRIIHGKGRGSGNRGPVLKQKTASVLHRQDCVLAYASARAVDGGTGATHVLLRRR